MLDYRFNILYSYTNKKLTLQDISSSQGEGEGEVWFGLVWFGLVWFGLVWFGMVWFGLINMKVKRIMACTTYLIPHIAANYIYLSISIYLSIYL